MLFSSASILSLALLVPSALADLYVTAPVASTVCNANQACAIAWNDDGKAPTLAKIGMSHVGLYVGSVQTQVLLQTLGVVDVSNKASASFVVDPKVGGDSNLYFVRFTSLALKDAASPQYPWEGFSAKFALKGMTGEFNSTVAGLMTGAGSVASSTVAASSGLATVTRSSASASSTSAAASSSLTPVIRASSTASTASTASHASATGVNHTGAAFQTSQITGKALSAGAALMAVLLGAVAI